MSESPCACGFGPIIEEAQRRLDALSPEEKAERERRLSLNRLAAAEYALASDDPGLRAIALRYLTEPVEGAA